MNPEKPSSLDSLKGNEQLPPVDKKLETGEIPRNPAGDAAKEFSKEKSTKEIIAEALETIEADPTNVEDVKFAEKLIQSIPTSKLLEESSETLRKVFLNKDNVVDFRGHSGAKWKIGVGDLVPRSTEYARVDGELGKRSIFGSGKVGYLDQSGEYLAIWGGEKIDEKPEVSAEEKASLENIKIASLESETAAKQSFLNKTKQEEVTEKKTYGKLLEKLNKMGLKIDGLDPQDFAKLDKEKVKNFFLEMSPAEVYEFRKEIDRGGKKYSTVNFRALMKITGLDKETVSEAKTLRFIQKTLEGNSVFPASEVSKIGLGSEARVFQKILRIESAFKPFAVSGTGALGIAQMTSLNYKPKNFNPFDWQKSIKSQIEHFRAEYQRFGDIEKAIVAYNRGGGYVSKMSRLHGLNWHFKMNGTEYGQQGYDYLRKMETLRDEDKEKMEK